VSEGPLAGQSPGDADSVVDVRDWFSFAQDKVPLLTKLFLGQEQLVGFSGQEMISRSCAQGGLNQR